MTGFGSTPFSPQYPDKVGREVHIVASGSPRYKTGGITLDWNTVLPVYADTIIAEQNRKILSGQHYLRYGTVLCLITAATAGGAIGKYGPYTPAMSATDSAGAITAGDLIIHLDAGGEDLFPGDFLHIAAGGGTAEDVQVKSVDGNDITLASPCLYSHNDETVITKPDDGRQTLRRGECFFLPNTLVKETDLMSDHPGNCFDGDCTVYLTRVTDIDTNPSRADLEDGFPTITWLF